MLPLLSLLKKKRARLITNMRSANPIAAGQKIVRLAEELGLEICVAVVTGDDVLDVLDPDAPSMEDGCPGQDRGNRRADYGGHCQGAASLRGHRSHRLHHARRGCRFPGGAHQASWG